MCTVVAERKRRGGEELAWVGQDFAFPAVYSSGEVLCVSVCICILPHHVRAKVGACARVS